MFLAWLIVTHNMALTLLWALGMGAATLNATALLVPDAEELLPYRYTVAYMTAVSLLAALDPVLFRRPLRLRYIAFQLLRVVPSVAFWLLVAPREPLSYESVVVQACDGLMGILVAMQRADEAVPPGPSPTMSTVAEAASVLLLPVGAIVGHGQLFWQRSLWMFNRQKRVKVQAGILAYVALAVLYSLLQFCALCRKCSRSCKCKEGCKRATSGAQEASSTSVPTEGHRASGEKRD